MNTWLKKSLISLIITFGSLVSVSCGGDPGEAENKTESQLVDQSSTTTKVHAEISSKKIKLNLPVLEEVKIGTQTWTLKNLDVSRFRNGDPIPEAKSDEEWKSAGEEGNPAWCYYENNSDNGKIYGKLYNWFAVIDPRGLAPEGWYIPSHDEWKVLTDYLGGGSAIAGTKMKSTSGWGENGNGTNESGFTGLAGGGRYGFAQKSRTRTFPLIFNFGGVGAYGVWWSSSRSGSSSEAHSRALAFDNGRVSYYSANSMEDGISVRMMKDEPPRPASAAGLEGVTIGHQVWAKQNLNVTHFRNGDPIPQAQSDEEWTRAGREGSPAWSHYTDSPTKQYEGRLNGEKFGKLYNWFAVNDPRGLAPKGWHVPTDAEWVAFLDYLKYQRPIRNEPDETVRRPGSVDVIDSEFAALAGGYRGSIGTFTTLGGYGSWWTASYAHGDYAWDRKLLFGYGQFISRGSVFRKDVDKANGSSVRVVRD